MSEILFATQGDYGIDAGGTAGGNVAGEQCHTTKKYCDSGKNEWISASNSEEQAIHQPRNRKGSRETQQHPQQRQRHALTEN
jgi:putative heme iron utilization protein